MRWLLIVVIVLAGPAFGQTLTRGPYLQLASPTGVTIVFRTSVAGIGRVRYGLAGQALTQSVADTQATTEHVLRLGAEEAVHLQHRPLDRLHHHVINGMRRLTVEVAKIAVQVAPHAVVDFAAHAAFIV